MFSAASFGNNLRCHTFKLTMMRIYREVSIQDSIALSYLIVLQAMLLGSSCSGFCLKQHFTENLCTATSHCYRVT